MVLAPSAMSGPSRNRMLAAAGFRRSRCFELRSTGFAPPELARLGCFRAPTAAACPDAEMAMAMAMAMATPPAPRTQEAPRPLWRHCAAAREPDPATRE